MSKLNIVKSVIFLTILFALSACNKSDDNQDSFHPNGILILSESKMDITESTYTLNSGNVKEVRNIEPGIELEGSDLTFLALYNTDGTTTFLSIDPQTNIPDGGTVVYVQQFEPTLINFIGQSLDATTNDGFVRITGDLTFQSETITISIDLYQTQLSGGTSTYTIDGNDAIITGGLGIYTFNQLLEINADYPNVDRIVLKDIQGSIDDDVNVLTGKNLRKAGYATHILADTFIASGGVDLFTAGVKRTRVDETSRVGVHSWCCTENGQSGDQLPQDHPAHTSQLNYFKQMLGNTNGPAFYFFTLQAAPSDGVHFMTQAEVVQYNLLTD